MFPVFGEKEWVLLGVFLKLTVPFLSIGKRESIEGGIGASAREMWAFLRDERVRKKKKEEEERQRGESRHHCSKL